MARTFVDANTTVVVRMVAKAVCHSLKEVASRMTELGLAASDLVERRRLEELSTLHPISTQPAGATPGWSWAHLMTVERQLDNPESIRGCRRGELEAMEERDRTDLALCSLALGKEYQRQERIPERHATVSRLRSSVQLRHRALKTVRDELARRRPQEGVPHSAATSRTRVGPTRGRAVRLLDPAVANRHTTPSVAPYDRATTEVRRRRRCLAGYAPRRGPSARTSEAPRN